MNHHIDLARREAKKPMGLNNFKTFVHQRGGIDRDSSAHLPHRMLQRQVGSDTFQVLGVCLEERPTGTREDQPSDLFVAA